MIRQMSILKYPITIACIDDDLVFLKAISRTLGKKYLLKTFDSSINARDFFKEYQPSMTATRFLQGIRETENYNHSANAFVKFNIEDMANLITDESRLNDIGVLIIDYKMPQLDGIELCRSLKKLPLKKILLTGEAENPEAVNAFNEAIIDKYIRKDSRDLAENLMEHIENLIDQYFLDNTKLLLSHLEVENNFALSDSSFTEFFHKYCIENNTKEYYLIDKFGSFCLIDNENTISYLITHTDQTLDAFLEVYSDVEWAQYYLNKIKNRELIPFFGIGKEPWQISENDWSKFMFKPDLLEGKKQRYFVSVTKFKNV